MKKRLLLTFFIMTFTAVFFGAISGAIFAMIRDLPQIRSLESYAPSAVSRIYSADQVLLAELFVQRRDPVSLDQVPEALKTALITTEDRQFYDHSGLDIKGIARALVHDLKARKFVQGASTLTQQLAKTLFFSPEKSLERKLKETAIAFQLERRYTKDEILERYLNQVYFGSGAYGVKMAADVYFGKPVEDLDLAECALIAGLPKAPSAYSPLVNPELAVRRRNIVLLQMLNTGQISTENYEKAIDEPYVSPPKKSRSNKAPYFVDLVKHRLENELGSHALYRGGLTIHTTLSSRMQKAAETAMGKGLGELRLRMAANGTKNPDPQGALVAIEVETGGIAAMVGGRDYGESPFNRAVNAQRQPGSAFKPIIFALAIEQGFDQSSLLLDAPVAFTGSRAGEDWLPENFSNSFKGEITLRKALTHSENIPAVRLLRNLGPAAAIDFARSCGIKSAMSPYLSLALGAFEVNLLELTAAYAVFPNSGTYIEPFGVTEVIDPDGRVIWRKSRQKKMVMSRAGSAIMTDILKGAIEEGTGRLAADIAHPVAGKTGTTNQFRDAMFIGFSPAIAAGVWTGNDDFTTLGRYETGSRAALPVWKYFMTEALGAEPITFFDLPDDVIQIRIDPDTGERVKDDQKGVAARFRKDNIPQR